MISMSGSLVARYRRWFEYEQDAHQKVIQSLESVPAERRDSPEFRKAVDLLAHISGARRMWLTRLGVAPPISANLFPTNANLDDIADQLRTTQELWHAYLAKLTDADLERDFDYQSLDAGRFRNRVEDILAQLYGHSWYHRGQIAMLVKRAGGVPAITDLIYWCREPIS
jgi:uncharacterized damage-inducible protein DinB